MFRNIKMVVHHAHLFAWLLRHTVHKDHKFEFNALSDFVEGDKTITTIARCLHCGKTLEFAIPKKSHK